MIARMKYSIRQAAAVFAALCISAGIGAGEAVLPGLEGVPEVVAEVQGKPITRTELVRELVGSNGSKALERIINRILIEQAAAEKRLSVTPEDIELQFKRDVGEIAQSLIRMPWMNARAQVPVEEIVQAQLGMSVADYKNIVIRQRLLSRRCMAREINPSENDLRRFFDSYPDLFQHPIKYRASHILITPLNPNDLFRGTRLRGNISPVKDYQSWLQRHLQRVRDEKIDVAEDISQEIDAAWAQAKNKAERLARELMANPGKWNEYVLAYSQDPMDRAVYSKSGQRQPTQRERMKLRMVPGDVDWFTKFGPLVPEFYQGAKDLGIGQISFPIQTQFGYHIIKMLEVYRPPPVTYADAREHVRDLYIENEIQLLSASWLAQLSRHADLKTEKATLWPPQRAAAKEHIGLPEPGAESENLDPDPIVGRVNGTPIKRSDVWSELLRSEGEDALRRLVNREVVLGILKKVGIAHMEWLCANPERRPERAPPLAPIHIDEERIQRQLNDDRLEYDRALNEKEYANLTFDEYIYRRYGQTPAEYRRAIEAGLVMLSAIRQKCVPRDREEFEKTLKVEFALARQQYSEKEWYEVSHILVVPLGGTLKAGAEELMAARSTADELYLQLRAAPQKFDELVEKFSDDTPENKAAHGSLGGCYEGRTMPNFPESLQFYNEIKKQNLEVGQFTPVLQSARGYHIVRLDAKHPAVKAEFAEKRAQVERDYINEQAKFYAEIWVRALNNRAVVKHFYFKQSFAYDLPDVDQSQLPNDNFGLPNK